MNPGIFFIAAAAVCSSGASAKPFHTKFKSPDADFEYSWSSEVSAVPALVKRFTADMRKRRAETMTDGREFNELRKETGSTGDIGFMYSANIRTAGQTPRLLSLETAIARYSGGAHSNYGFDALLWDRRREQEIGIASLFVRADTFEALTRPLYCKALDAERLRRRYGAKFGGRFDECPKNADLAIAPADKDRDGRFEAIDFVAAPYTAGPFSDGEYAIAVPVTPQLISGIRPEYRGSFKAHRQ